MVIPHPAFGLWEWVFTSHGYPRMVSGAASGRPYEGHLPLKLAWVFFFFPLRLVIYINASNRLFINSSSSFFHLFSSSYSFYFTIHCYCFFLYYTVGLKLFLFFLWPQTSENCLLASLSLDSPSLSLSCLSHLYSYLAVLFSLLVILVSSSCSLRKSITHAVTAPLTFKYSKHWWWWWWWCWWVFLWGPF